MGSHKKSKSYLNSNMTDAVFRDQSNMVMAAASNQYHTGVNYPPMMMMGSSHMVAPGTLENSFVQSGVNKSYERLMGETIDA